MRPSDKFKGKKEEKAITQWEITGLTRLRPWTQSSMLAKRKQVKVALNSTWPWGNRKWLQQLQCNVGQGTCLAIHYSEYRCFKGKWKKISPHNVTVRRKGKAPAFWYLRHSICSVQAMQPQERPRQSGKYLIPLTKLVWTINCKWNSPLSHPTLVITSCQSDNKLWRPPPTYQVPCHRNGRFQNL